jgi:hypothetical protein
MYKLILNEEECNLVVAAFDFVVKNTGIKDIKTHIKLNDILTKIEKNVDCIENTGEINEST